MNTHNEIIKSLQNTQGNDTKTFKKEVTLLQAEKSLIALRKLEGNYKCIVQQ